jgi:hypothetical protein
MDLLVIMFAYHSTFEIQSISVICYILESYPANHHLASGLDEDLYYIKNLNHMRPLSKHIYTKYSDAHAKQGGG